MCSKVTRVSISKVPWKGQRFRFLQTHFGDASFQEKTEAEEIRGTVISVAFPKADCEVQVSLLSEIVFQSHCPLPLKNGNVTLVL